VYGFNNEQVGIYAVCWLVAFCASLSRSARDADGISVVRILGLGSSSGFFAVGAIGLGFGNLDGASPLYLLGISAVVGLMSTEQDKLVKAVYAKISRLFLEKGE